jgi:hypothetical protein
MSDIIVELSAVEVEEHRKSKSRALAKRQAKRKELQKRKHPEGVNQFLDDEAQEASDEEETEEVGSDAEFDDGIQKIRDVPIDEEDDD